MKQQRLVLAVAVAITLALVIGAGSWPHGVAQDAAPDAESPPEVPRRERLRNVRVVRALAGARFRRPIWVGALPDGSGRIAVAEQDGRLLLIPATVDGAAPSKRTPDAVLDLREKVRRQHNEEGLLGLAFHPGFAKNGRLFVHYSASKPRRGVISEFALRDDRIDPRSERVLLEQKQPYGNHNGGSIDFGPDGFLYVSFGDGGAANDPLGSGQDLSTWLGALLRIDVDGKRPYAIPPGNPFVKTRGARPEIWAYGLRNVWRMAFDPLTGELWAGDVGQNLYEEIDVIVRGGNYGWNAREGLHPFGRRPAEGTYIDPVVEHPRSEAASITGGVVYRGKLVPSLYGAYVYADYATGNIWAVRRRADGSLDRRRVARHASITHFGVDPHGEVLIASFDGGIHRLQAREGEAEPDFPVRLSETGLFSDLADHQPADGFVRYAVNVPLWSDGSQKQRFIRLPKGSQVRVQADGTYRFPDGVVFLKTFLRPGAVARDEKARLETRVIELRAGRWLAVTYVWNPTLTDALRVDEPHEQTYAVKVKGRSVERRWTFPGQSDCYRCHLPQAGFVLGFRPEQLDTPRPKDAPAQLDRLVSQKLFDGDPRAMRPPFRDWHGPDREASARAYLDVQCAHCHRPDGPGNATIDLRASTPLAETGLLGAKPGQGDLGVKGARLLLPGQPRRSILWLRMGRTDENGMPNVAHGVPDQEALRRISTWIRSLKSSK